MRKWQYGGADWKIVELPCECGRVWERPVDEDDDKNEIVTFACKCGEKKMILIAERCILRNI